MEKVTDVAQQRGWWVTINPQRGGIVCLGYVELQKNNTLIVCKFDGDEMKQAVRYRSDSSPWKADGHVTGLLSADIVERWTR